MKYFWFILVILLANIIQGITGFAGTVLAMPFSLMLVGYDTAKPILNFLGLLSGLYVFAESYHFVVWKEVRKIAAIMLLGIVMGIFLKQGIAGKSQLLNQLLGGFILLISFYGLYRLKQIPDGKVSLNKNEKFDQIKSISMLVLAGAAHGIFVSGGPLLIAYLSEKINNKSYFRATASTVWIILNSVILAGDIQTGLWNWQLFKLNLLAIPFLFSGMYIGAKIYARLSQQLFMKITYLLLIVSGTLLLVK